jgi:hypothetical protein
VPPGDSAVLRIRRRVEAALRRTGATRMKWYGARTLATKTGRELVTMRAVVVGVSRSQVETAMRWVDEARCEVAEGHGSVCVRVAFDPLG